jgi:TRAP-type transport system small permease protein
LPAFINKFSKAIDQLTRWVNYLGAAALAVMMLLTATDVMLRYFLNKPILGSYELTEYLMVVLAACTIGYTAKVKGHVNVDLILKLFPNTVQNIVYVITNFCCIIFFALLSWRAFYQSGILREAGSASANLAIPDFPLVILLGIGFAIVALVFVIHTLESIAKVIGKWTPL